MLLCFTYKRVGGKFKEVHCMLTGIIHEREINYEFNTKTILVSPN